MLGYNPPKPGRPSHTYHTYFIANLRLVLDVEVLQRLGREHWPAFIRADCENNFDELKNHWGWGGFTTQDLKRSRFMARMTALVYNGWSLFVRLRRSRQAHRIDHQPNVVAPCTAQAGT